MCLREPNITLGTVPLTLSLGTCHGRNGSPKIGSPRNLFHCKFRTPSEKFGPLQVMCWNYFFNEYGPPGTFSLEKVNMDSLCRSLVRLSHSEVT